MRVLMVAPEFPPQIGGMELYAIHAAKRFLNAGNQVIVATTKASEPTLASPHYFFYSCLSRNFNTSRRRIRALIRRHAPDLLFMLNAGFAPILLGGIKLPIPVVVRTAGNDAYGAWFGPRLPFRFLLWRLPSRSSASLGRRLRHFDQDFRVERVLRSLGSCARVLCNSSYTVSRLAEFGVPHDLLHAVPGGVDTSAFHPFPKEPLTAFRRPPVLGVVGNLKPIKGIDVALRALSKLAGPASQARLLIAGSGPEEHRLRRLTGELGIESRVDFLGAVSPSAMPEFFGKLDLCLQPSVPVQHPISGALQEESMGRSLCEAQACAVPVVASRSGGIPDVVKHGFTGLLVPPSDIDALAEAVTTLLSSPSRLLHMGHTARQYVTESFSWEVVVRKTLDHLRSVLGQSHS